MVLGFRFTQHIGIYGVFLAIWRFSATTEPRQKAAGVTPTPTPTAPPPLLYHHHEEQQQQEEEEREQELEQQQEQQQ